MKSDLGSLRFLREGTLRVLLIWSAVLIAGCQENHSQVEQQRQIIRKNEELGKAYLQGDVANARASLLAAAQLLESATVLEPTGRCELVAKAYFRLYVMETRLGD